MKFVRYAVALVGAISALAHAAEPLSAEETKELQALGVRVFQIQWAAPVVGVQERDALALTDHSTTLTLRREARAFIVHNKGATSGKDPVGYVGSDGSLKERGLKILNSIKVPSQEIANIRVIQQMTRVGSLDASRKTVLLSEPQKSRRTLVANRVVDGVPVLSSHMSLTLDHDGRIAYMELSWPGVPSKIREEAHHLQEAVRRGLSAPAIEGTRVESKEAVIVHSPAASFFRSEERRVGKECRL